MYIYILAPRCLRSSEVSGAHPSFLSVFVSLNLAQRLPQAAAQCLLGKWRQTWSYTPSPFHRAQNWVDSFNWGASSHPKFRGSQRTTDRNQVTWVSFLGSGEFCGFQKLESILKEMPRTPASKTPENMKFKHSSYKQDGILEGSPMIKRLSPSGGFPPQPVQCPACTPLSSFPPGPGFLNYPRDTCLLVPLMLF